MKSKFSTDDVGKFFNYDSTRFADIRWLDSATARKDYEITSQYLLEFLNPDNRDNILEIGCGPGVWTDLISSRCHHMTAIDIAGEMIKEAKKRVAGDNVTFCETDFVKYQEDILYNKVFSVRVIEYFPEPMEVVRKIDKLLKVEGRAVIITKTYPSLMTLRAKLWEFLKRICSKGEKEPVPPMKMIPPGKLRRMFLKEGFKKVDIYPVVLRSPLFIHGKYSLLGVNEELRKMYEMLMLRFFNALSRKSKAIPQIIRYLLLPFSETYLVLAEK